MAYDPERHHRRSIRLRGYDYSACGAYFVTITIQNRLPLLGAVQQGAMEHSAAGAMVAEHWQALGGRFPQVALDAWVVMPDHMHGIIVLEANTAEPRPALGDVIGAFKSLTTLTYMHGVEAHGWPAFPRRLWQRNYYERIIRDQAALQAIRAYIEQNPQRWER